MEFTLANWNLKIHFSALTTPPLSNIIPQTHVRNNAFRYFTQRRRSKVSIFNYLRKFDGHVLYPTAKAVGFTTLIIMSVLGNCIWVT